MTDLAHLGVYERTERVENALADAFRLEGYEIGQDRDGRYVLVPSRSPSGDLTYLYMNVMAREIERKLFG